MVQIHSPLKNTSTQFLGSHCGAVDDFVGCRAEESKAAPFAKHQQRVRHPRISSAPPGQPLQVLRQQVFGTIDNPQRNSKKNVAMSPATAAGSSTGAKCPPCGKTVHRSCPEHCIRSVQCPRRSRVGGSLFRVRGYCRLAYSL